MTRHERAQAKARIRRVSAFGLASNLAQRTRALFLSHFLVLARVSNLFVRFHFLASFFVYCWLGFNIASHVCVLFPFSGPVVNPTRPFGHSAIRLGQAWLSP